MKRKFFLGFILMILSFIVLEKIYIIKVEYKTEAKYYGVEISRLSKKLKLFENNYCIDEKCEEEVIRKSISLTNKEYSFIKDILRQEYNKENFMSAVSSLVKDQEVMFYLGEDGYEEDDDLDNNGIITYREFAYSYLEILSK